MQRAPRVRIAAIAAAATTLLAACATSSATPAASSSPRELVNAPAGVSLLLFAGDRVRAVDWSGHEYLAPYGVPQPAAPLAAGTMPFRPAPDGSKIVNVVMPSAMWAHGTFAGGRPAPPANFGYDTSWSDDSSHLCAMSYNPDGSATAWIADGAGAWSRVVNAGRWIMNGGGPSIAACSWTAQRVAVRDLEGGNGETATVWVYTPDGHLLMTRHTAAQTWDIFTFSTDASTYADYNETTGDTTVFDLAGQQLASAKGEFIEAFSWSGRYALAMSSTVDLGTRPVHDPYVIDWRTGKVIWRAPFGTRLATGTYGDVALQPHGDGIAFPIQDNNCSNQATCDPALQIVSPAGALRFDGSAYLTWPVIWP